jgi:hypothetical protein
VLISANLLSAVKGQLLFADAEPFTQPVQLIHNGLIQPRREDFIHGQAPSYVRCWT